MDESKTRFWADLSRKTGTWAGVTALALAVGEQVEEWLDATAQASVGPHHAWAVVAVAVLRAVLGLVQGKIGDPASASFKAGADDDGDDGDA